MQMETELQRLRMDMSSLQASNNSLRDKLKDEKSKVAERSAQLQQYEDKVSKYDKMQLAMMDAQQELAHLRAKCEQLQTNLDASSAGQQSADLLELKDNIIEKQKLFSKELEGKLHSVESEIRASKLSVDGMAKKLELRSMDLKDANFKLRQRDELVEKMQKELDDKTMQLERLLMPAGDVDVSDTCQTSYVNEELSRCRQRLNEQIKVLKSVELHKSKLTSQLEEKNEEITSLKQQIDNANENVASGKVKERDNMEEIDNLKESLSSVQTDLDSANQRADDLYNQNSLLHQELQLKVKEVVKLSNSLLESKTEVSPSLTVAGPQLPGQPPAYSSVAGESAVCDALNAKIHAQEVQMRDLNSLLKFRDEQIQKMESEATQNSRKMTFVEQELADTKTKVKELEHSATAILSSSSKYQTEYISMKQNYDSVITARDAATNEKAAAKEALRQNKESTKKLTERNNDLEVKFKRFVEVFKDAKQELQTREKTIEKLESQVKELLTDNEVKRCELFDLKSRMDKFTDCSDSLKCAERKVSDLEAVLNSERVQLDSVVKERDMARQHAIHLEGLLASASQTVAAPVTVEDDDLAPPGTKRPRLSNLCSNCSLQVSSDGAMQSSNSLVAPNTTNDFANNHSNM